MSNIHSNQTQVSVGKHGEITEDVARQAEPMSMCPMASMCKGMAHKSRSRFLLMIPGLVLIILGVVILLQPKVLIWLIAAVSIVMGVLLLIMGNFMAKVGEQLRVGHG